MLEEIFEKLAKVEADEKKEETTESKNLILHITWQGEEDKEDRLVALTKGNVEDSYGTVMFNHLYLSFPSTDKAQEALRKVKAARWSWVEGAEIEEK